MARKLFSALTAALLATVLCLAGYVWWLRSTPHYSLALLVLEANRDGADEMGLYIDLDSVISRFMVQVRDAAVELYGRGVPPSSIEKLERFAEPLKPKIREMADREVKRLLRERTAEVAGYPPSVIATGMLALTSSGKSDSGTVVKVTLPDGGEVELVLEPGGGRWRIVEIRDDRVARRIAETVGQEVLLAAAEGGLDKVAKTFKINDVDELMRKLDGILK